MGWYGPLFWPYAYSDIFDYTFWPFGYAPGYWDYAYDDLFDGIYYGDAVYVPGYGYIPGAYAAASGRTRVASASRAQTAHAAQLCKQPGEGVTAFPFDSIDKTVKLTDDQKPLFDDLKNAARKASGTFAAACPDNAVFAQTPPGRLDTMIARLSATEEAVQTVKPALDKFYASLSDEQKARFNQLGPAIKGMATASRASSETTGSAAAGGETACGSAKPGLTNLPIKRISDAVKPTGDQQAALQDLRSANEKAVERLQAACPQQQPQTPPGRLDAMDQHLKAMIGAANIVKPALDRFYGSLSDEQKARFNQLGRSMPTNG